MTDRQTRPERIYVRVSEEERAKLQAEADAEGRTLSQYVRWKLLAGAKG